MKNAVTILFLLPLFLWTTVLQAAEPEVTMRVDRDTITEQEQVTLSVIIRGGSAMSSPEMASQGNFDVVGRSSMNSVEAIQGNMSVTKIFEYVLEPRKVGDFSIGPATVRIDGKAYTAGPVRVKVLADTGPKPFIPTPPQQQAMPGFPNFPSMPGMPPFPNPNMPGFPGMNPDPTPNLPSGNHGTTFLTAEIDKRQAFVGEQVLFVFRLYSAVSLQEATLSLPDFKDFIAEELIKERKYEVTLEGRRYAVNEWRSALFPTRSGEIKITPAFVKAVVPVGGNPFSGFGMPGAAQAKTFATEALAIQVRDLPPAPPGFTGLVGQFTLKSQLTPTQLKLGETANFELRFEGRGNIGEANIPDFPSLGEFKVYPSKPVVNLQKSLEGMQGEKIFKYALVAEKPGQATVPELDLSFFNPQSGSYEKLSAPAVSVAVEGSATQEKLVTAGSESAPPTAAPSFDIADIQPVAAVLHQPPQRWNGILLFVLGVSLSVFAATVFLEMRKRHRSERDDDRRRSRAFRKAKQDYAKIAGLSKAEDASDEEIRVLHRYLGDRFGVKAASLTSEELPEFLREHGVADALARELQTWFEAREHWRYGGAKTAREGRSLLEILQDVERGL